jgi:hypothetical protein
VRGSRLSVHKASRAKYIYNGHLRKKGEGYSHPFSRYVKQGLVWKMCIQAGCDHNPAEEQIEKLDPQAECANVTGS